MSLSFRNKAVKKRSKTVKKRSKNIKKASKNIRRHSIEKSIYSSPQTGQSNCDRVIQISVQAGSQGLLPEVGIERGDGPNERLGESL